MSRNITNGLKMKNYSLQKANLSVSKEINNNTQESYLHQYKKSKTKNNINSVNFNSSLMINLLNSGNVDDMHKNINNNNEACSSVFNSSVYGKMKLGNSYSINNPSNTNTNTNLNINTKLKATKMLNITIEDNSYYNYNNINNNTNNNYSHNNNKYNCINKNNKDNISNSYINNSNLGIFSKKHAVNNKISTNNNSNGNNNGNIDPLKSYNNISELLKQRSRNNNFISNTSNTGNKNQFYSCNMNSISNSMKKSFINLNNSHNNTYIKESEHNNPRKQVKNIRYYTKKSKNYNMIVYFFIFLLYL